MTVPRYFDLSQPAPNGLRRGRSTGACATAAVQAALLLLLRGERVAEVSIRLPDPSPAQEPTVSGSFRGRKCRVRTAYPAPLAPEGILSHDQFHGSPALYLRVPVHAVRHWEDGARAEVVKDGGDDPDCTHGAVIFAQVRRNTVGSIRFYAASGVGTVTAPGLRVAVGEPAINPVPRRMMAWAVQAVAGSEAGFDLAIGCENGVALARKTYNPRLGIVGGISILGTSGIVEPMSLAAYQASIEVYIRVALAAGQGASALLPGKIGAAYGRESLGLTPRAMVQIANFLGFAVDQVQSALEQGAGSLDTLWLLGHPGKLAKVLDGHWDTHSSRSAMAMAAIAREAAAFGLDAETAAALARANTVEAMVQPLSAHPAGWEFWLFLEHRIAEAVAQRAPAVPRVAVRLFDLHGAGLGAALHV
ncbi:MAG: cobalamin biosynthesis protein CbiD [Methylococcaceae bacterium]|nr:MAG: cobalamin biosynthesis protein CbiD [Methylococcaceae bacterium]